MTIELTKDEGALFNYILPVTGSFQDLLCIESIIEKSKDGGKIDFTDDEWTVIIESIEILNKQKKLHIQVMPLVKILYKGDS